MLWLALLIRSALFGRERQVEISLFRMADEPLGANDGSCRDRGLWLGPAQLLFVEDGSWDRPIGQSWLWVLGLVLDQVDRQSQRAEHHRYAQEGPSDPSTSFPAARAASLHSFFRSFG